MENNLLTRASAVKNMLLNDSIKVRNDWIEECVKFFVNQVPNIDDQTLYQQAFEQFLLADFKDASNPVIPSTILENKQIFTLNDNFVLQLNFLIDIAESPYEQWRRLHNIKLDDVEDNKESKTFNTRKKRMLKLELTDGHKIIHAMEYLTIQSLNTKIPPGSKIRINGPLQVVNHVLLLEPRNLKILGGDVDDLLIPNAYENVLLRALNKPTTTTPVRDYIEEVLKENLQRIHNNVQPRPIPLPEPEENFLTGVNFDEEDEVDLEMLNQIEEEDRIRRQSQEYVREDDAFLAHLNFDGIANEVRGNELVEIIEIPDIPQRQIIQANDLISIPLIEIPDDDENEQHLSELTKSSNHTTLRCSDDQLPKKIARLESTSMRLFSDNYYKFKSHEGDNMLTVDQYLSLTTAEKMRKKYVVWGSLNPCLSSLRIKEKVWELNCDLFDPYSHQQLGLKLHNSVLENLSGVTGPEMKLKYKEARQQPQLKEDIRKIFENLANTIRALKCFMRIEMKLQTCPQLVELLDDNSSNNQTFATKLKEENLKEI